jgi:hypothetical protein
LAHIAPLDAARTAQRAVPTKKDVRARRREAVHWLPGGVTYLFHPQLVGEAIQHPDGFIVARHGFSNQPKSKSRKRKLRKLK